MHIVLLNTNYGIFTSPMKAKTSSPPTANNWIPHKVDGSISRGLPLHSPHIPESPRAITAYPHVTHNCHFNNYKFKSNCMLCQYKERLADCCKDNSYVCVLDWLNHYDIKKPLYL